MNSFCGINKEEILFLKVRNRGLDSEWVGMRTRGSELEEDT